MMIETRPLGVGLIGSSPSTLFLSERLVLRRDFQTAAFCTDDASARAVLVDRGGSGHPEPRDVINDPHVQVVYFAATTASSLIGDAIRAGKSIVLESPMRLSSDELNRLGIEATEHGVPAVIHELSRWDSEFLSALSAVATRQLGDVKRLRLTIHEHGLPGETFPRGVLRELGFRWFLQLHLMVDAMPSRVVLRRFTDANSSVDSGFLAIMDFENGTSALIEVQTRSKLSYRTGWLIEGTNAAYRAGRLYSQTADGEIIDEPLPPPVVSNDLFLDSLAMLLRGEDASLPTLHDAAKAVEFIERLEQSTW